MNWRELLLDVCACQCFATGLLALPDPPDDAAIFRLVAVFWSTVYLRWSAP